MQLQDATLLSCAAVNVEAAGSCLLCWMLSTVLGGEVIFWQIRVVLSAFISSSPKADSFPSWSVTALSHSQGVWAADPESQSGKYRACLGSVGAQKKKEEEVGGRGEKGRWRSTILAQEAAQNWGMLLALKQPLESLQVSTESWVKPSRSRTALFFF